jgi:1-deoxy-D-xylulose-5-phosphate reductoisomerase
MRNIVVLGSTGSIGRQTLEVAAQFPERVRVVGLATHRNVEQLKAQARQFKPRYVAVVDELAAQEYGEPANGKERVIEMVVAPEVDLVVVATVGAAGLLPTLAALEAGKLVALANKETLVMAGPVIKERLQHGGRLIPIDSEHSAIWQCLQGEPKRSIEKLVLTASGGALRHLPESALATVTPEQALNHPTWNMGAKITVDSATLMNKGLEVLEATWLFDVPIERIDIVMHTESIVHSLVYFDDSSVKAQLGLPDMRLPIQYALSYPERWGNDLPRLNLAEVGMLHFGPVNWNRYPCLRLAIEAGRRGGTYPAVLCAADEVAVSLFLARSIRFSDIPRIIEQALTQHEPCPQPSLDDILQADSMARELCEQLACKVS